MTKKHHSNSEKEEAVAAWIASGTYSGAARVCGVNQVTIRFWHKNQPDWWDKVAVRVREENEERHRANLTKIMDKCSEEILDRLENGDEHINAKGEKHLIKVKAQPLAVILGITSEKRALSLGLPTSIAGRPDSSIDKLAELKRAGMAARNRAIKDGDVAELKPTGTAGE